MSFTVAIVGRPNVGKSTLFNRLVGRRLALVDDRPGVTRDRREGHARLGDLAFTVIDTAGLEEADAGEPHRPHAGADRGRDRGGRCRLLHDRRACRVERRSTVPSPISCAASGKPTDRDRQQERRPAGPAGAIEAYALGLGEPMPISAEHGEGLSDLYDALREALPEQTPAHVDEDAGRECRPGGTADPRRDRRPAQHRQVDAGQSPAGRGAAADRARGRHHARRHRGRRRLARAGASASTTPPACAARRASRRSSRSSRSPMRSMRCALPRW